MTSSEAWFTEAVNNIVLSAVPCVLMRWMVSLQRGGCRNYSRLTDYSFYRVGGLLSIHTLFASPRCCVGTTRDAFVTVDAPCARYRACVLAWAVYQRMIEMMDPVGGNTSKRARKNVKVAINSNGGFVAKRHMLHGMLLARLAHHNG